MKENFSNKIKILDENKSKKKKNIIKNNEINKNSYVKEKININYEYANIQFWKNLVLDLDKELLDNMEKIFKYNNYRENQKSIINAVILKHDVFVCLPTGGGKSIIYQLPAITENGVSLVIMPLKSLILDQTNKLKEYGIDCFEIKSSINYDDPEKIIEDEFFKIQKEKKGYSKIIFITPEKLEKSTEVKKQLKKLYEEGLLNRLVVDEAHCVSLWGSDFRKDYLNIKNIKNICPNLPILALTATATENTRRDIIKKLDMKNTLYFKNSFNRNNLFYKVRDKNEDCISDIVNLINSNHKNHSGIIYCSTVKNCNKIYNALNKYFIILKYNADMEDKVRNEYQKLWMENKYKIIVATIAFGMGIDKPDVRFIIHYNISKSIENYYQESGRAGRDGEKSYCYIYYKNQDKSCYDKFITDKNLDNENNILETFKLNMMIKYCKTYKCRRKILLKYFGEEFNENLCNKNCDNCENKKELIKIDISFIVKIIINSGIRIKELTVKIFLKILEGIESKYNNEKIYGILKGYEQIGIKIINKMIFEKIIYEKVVSKVKNEKKYSFRIILFNEVGYEEIIKKNKKLYIKILKKFPKSYNIFTNENIIDIKKFIPGYLINVYKKNITNKKNLKNLNSINKHNKNDNYTNFSNKNINDKIDFDEDYNKKLEKFFYSEIKSKNNNIILKEIDRNKIIEIDNLLNKHKENISKQLNFNKNDENKENLENKFNNENNKKIILKSIDYNKMNSTNDLIKKIEKLNLKNKIKKEYDLSKKNNKCKDNMDYMKKY